MEKIQEIGYNIYFKLTDLKFWYDIHKDEILDFVEKNKDKIIYMILCMSVILILLFNKNV